MENLKTNLAKNLIALRKANNYTQLDLANKLNYSDKAISKWERGESIPDVEILYQLANLYGVTIDELISKDNIVSETTEVLDNKIIKRKLITKLIIVLLSILLVWILATCTYVFLAWFWENQIDKIYLVFIYAIPVSGIVGLVFNCVWGKNYLNPIISSIILWTSVLCFYLTSNFENNSFVFFIAIPIQVAAILWFFLIISKK